MEIVVAGMADAANNGTFTLLAANAGTFTVANSVGATASSQSGTGAVVVEISTSFPTGCDVNGLGIPGGVAGGVRFRVSSAASADSTKVLVGKCDAGSTTVIRTSDDTPVLDLPAPPGTSTPPNGGNAVAAESSLRDGRTVGRTSAVELQTSDLGTSDLGLQTSDFRRRTSDVSKSKSIRFEFLVSRHRHRKTRKSFWEYREVRGLTSEVRGLTPTEADSTRADVRGPRADVRGPRADVRGPRADVRGRTSEVRRPRSGAKSATRPRLPLARRTTRRCSAGQCS